MRTETVRIGSAIDRGRLREAIESGIEELVLDASGPTLPSSLAQDVSGASAAGCRVVLDAEPAAFGSELAASLRAAGLALVRIRCGTFTDALADAIAAFRGAGIDVELSVRVFRSSLLAASRLPEEVLARFGREHGIAKIRVSVPLDASDRADLVSYSDAAECVRALHASAALAHIPLVVADGDPMPPCVLEHPERTLSLFKLETGAGEREGFVRLPPCAECSVAESCPGLPQRYLRLHAAHDLYPVPPVEHGRPATAPELVRRDGDRHVISVVYHCDQACGFCWVPTYASPPPDADIRNAIAEAARDGARVVLSGGEPTLHHSLAEYVRLARDTTRRGVWIETNALAFGELERARELAAAGLERAIVSLHGSRPEIADAVTRSPGTFVKTAEGIDRLHEAGVAVTLRFVVCHANVGDLDAYVRMAAARWPAAAIDVTLVEHRSDLVPRTASSVLPHAEVLPALARAKREAERLGVPAHWPALEGLVPLCAPDAPASDRPRPTPDHLKVAACHGCDRDPDCPGVERAYAHIHGIAALRPIVRAR